MAALPPDLQDVLDQITQADHAGTVLAAGVMDAQFHWQPRDGRGWSIAQCLEHLATMNELYGGCVRRGVELARSKGWRRTGPIASTFFGRRFIASQEPPVTRRLTAPSKTQPGSSRTREEILQLYHDAHRKLRDTITDCADIDVNRATFQNPFLPLIKVRVGTGLRIIAAHDRRHVWQAEQVKKATGYPS
jgi:hypothetical protein